MNVSAFMGGACILASYGHGNIRHIRARHGDSNSLSVTTLTVTVAGQTADCTFEALRLHASAIICIVIGMACLLGAVEPSPCMVSVPSALSEVMFKLVPRGLCPACCGL